MCARGEVDAMKVCVTAIGPGIDSEVDPRFGRAQYFVFVDTDGMRHESIPNPNINAYGGAGVKSAQLVVEKGVQVVITGHVGPNAQEALQAAGIKVVTGAQGMSVREAVDRYLKGELSESMVGDHGKGGEGYSLIRRLFSEVEELKKRVERIEKRLEEISG